MTTLTDHVFAELRPHLASLLRLPLDSVQPQLRLSDCLPLWRLRRVRQELAKQTGLRIPELQYQAAVHVPVWPCIAAALGAGALTTWYGWAGFALPVAAIAGAAAFYLADRIARGSVVDEEHPAIVTLGDLAQWTLALNMKTCRQRYGLKANHNEILTTIRAFLLEQLDVDPRRVTEDFCFAELD